jgi:hypothetical protein
MQVLPGIPFCACVDPIELATTKESSFLDLFDENQQFG